jgi:hypothetical protein
MSMIEDVLRKVHLIDGREFPSRTDALAYLGEMEFGVDVRRYVDSSEQEFRGKGSKTRAFNAIYPFIGWAIENGIIQRLESPQNKLDP